MRNPFCWLRTRNAAILARRTDDAARTKGVVFVEDQRDDPCPKRWPVGASPHWCVVLGEHTRHVCPCGQTEDEAPGADEVADRVCRRRWDVDPDIDNGAHTVQHLCVVTIPEHGYHECACGAWRLEIGATP
jgi:hypothetical protein